MREVVINGVRYAAPFADLFRDLTPAERAALTESAKRDGIHTPVLVYDSEAHGRAVIDGVNRAEVAAESGLELRFVDLGPISDDEALRIAEDVNAARRHLSPEEQQRVRSERVERVAAMRAEGNSLRVIAAEVGVSAEQVRQDVKEATVKGLTVEPDKVKGKDGKTRTAKPAKKQPEPVKQDTPDGAGKADGRTPEPPSSGGVSEAGEGGESEERPTAPPEPVHPADEFVAAINRACVALDRVKADVLALKPHSFSRHVHFDSVTHQIEAARSALWQSRPTEPCGRCPDEGPHKADCRACFGTGRTRVSMVLKGSK